MVVLLEKIEKREIAIKNANNKNNTKKIKDRQKGMENQGNKKKKTNKNLILYFGRYYNVFII